MAQWFPSGLPEWVANFASAMDRRFALRVPAEAVRFPTVKALPPADQSPNGVVIFNGKLVLSRVGPDGAFVWFNADGSAL